MADDTTIIEGTVKFRDGKKWKSRWCVMRKLSPAADCVHLQLYRDARARCGAAGCKAALSLQRYLGCESGFTLDRHCHTLALVCADLVAVLAFDTRERLIQWQVKVSAALGAARQHVVLVGGGPLAGGPARLHLRGRRVALTAGAPPRLLGVWELAHLRRYGVVDGRFCFEGGSRCGKGEGLHVLIADRAADLADDFDLAARGRLSPRRRPPGARRPDGGPGSRGVSTVDGSLPPLDLRLREDRRADEEGAVSPCWASTERPFRDMGHGDATSVNGAVDGADAGAWAGGGRVSLERCASCMSKLGALSRSSTAALTPAGFSPAWTMDAPREAAAGAAAALEPADERAPARPPKPTRLELNLNRKPPMAPPTTQTCGCARIDEEDGGSRIGPYENYDVPKLASWEVDDEHYDTPKRLKERLSEEPFRMTRSSTASAVILKKPCGCLLRLGRRRGPTVRAADEAPPAAACPCRRVTAWAHGWLGRAARRAASSDDLQPDPRAALYATVDLARKARRRTHPADDGVEVDDGPLADYENLNFALSLEHYENAKDLLRRAGVTQAELDAIGRELAPRAAPAADDYLVMEPAPGRAAERVAGYTPMSPAAPPPPPPGAPLPPAPACECAGARPASSSAGSASPGAARRARSAPGAGNRDSSSSNDSGVSSCSLRRSPAPAAPARRRSRSTDPLRETPRLPAKSSSAEAEVPVLSHRPLRGILDAHSTSSGTSDMSDYIETLSLCSSHSSEGAPAGRVRPRSAREYLQLAPRARAPHRHEP